MSDQDVETGKTTDEGQNDMVPRDAFIAMREDRDRREDALRRENAELRKKVEGGTRKETPTPLTRAQLQAQVDSGEMSEYEMDEILERQRDERLVETVTSTVDKKLSSTQRAQKIEAEASRYLSAVPDIEKEGSPVRLKVQAEIRALADLGDDPDDPGTWIKAMRSALGPVEALEKSKSTETRESHEEMSGSSGEDEGEGGKSGAPKGLTAREKSHYKAMIDKGMYSGWDDEKLQKELEYRVPQRAKRMQERYGNAA